MQLPNDHGARGALQDRELRVLLDFLSGPDPQAMKQWAHSIPSQAQTEK